MIDPNESVRAQARANVAARNNPAHRRAIMAGEWDGGTLVQEEEQRLLRNPPDRED
jgi:hypothetical protein